MQGNAEWLTRYMEGSQKRFVIPVYQRNYDWKIKQCKQLFDDLVKVAKENRKSHFFGSIVSVYNHDGHQLEFLIIDGQQRLTTISLLLLAMYNLIEEGSVEAKSKTLSRQIYDEYLVDKYQPEETRIKLKPVKNDKLAYDRLFDARDDNIADSNLTINYDYFYERLHKAEIEIDDLFGALNRLQIIEISLNPEYDNPQLIFESLNSTGLDLSEGDKIRNYVLMGLPSKTQEQFYERYWNKIELCAAYDVSSFVRDYLSVKQQSTPKEADVYVKFKEYVEGSALTDTEELLIDLLAMAKRYEVLLKGSSPYKRVNECIYRLNRLKTTVTRPFLLEVLRMMESGVINEKELGEVFQIVEDYVFRRNICDVPTNALNKVFLLLQRDVVRLDSTEDDYLEKLKYVLINKKESNRYPNDEEFIQALATKSIYNMRGESKLYLFERLENAGTEETKDVWNHIDNGDYSIEHIMPQTLTTTWIDDLGSDYERIHDTWLHKLANLTLTAYNSKYSNRPFIDKRDMENGFKQSGLRCNQWISQKGRWGEAELEERSEILQSLATQIWPYMETGYEPPQKQYETVTLDDEINLTGVEIAKYSLMGVEQAVETWIDMYQRVLIQLHEKDKSILTKLAVCEDPSIDLSVHFGITESSFNYCKEIDHNVFVWARLDTQYKINVLRKIFSIFNIEPTELVFYLRTDEEAISSDEGLYLTRRKYWTYALSIIREASGCFKNVNPTQGNWCNGYLGINGVHLCVVANYDSARAELYIEMPDKDKNKELFDYLYANKAAIENKAAREFTWERNDDCKSSRIYLSLNDSGISNEANWQKTANFQAEGSKVIVKAFGEYLTQYFEQ